MRVCVRACVRACRHQFMRLSGDPSFDKRAGKLVLTAGSLRKPDSVVRKK